MPYRLTPPTGVGLGVGVDVTGVGVDDGEIDVGDNIGDGVGVDWGVPISGWGG